LCVLKIENFLESQNKELTSIDVNTLLKTLGKSIYINVNHNTTPTDLLINNPLVQLEIERALFTINKDWNFPIQKLSFFFFSSKCVPKPVTQILNFAGLCFSRTKTHLVAMDNFQIKYGFNMNRNTEFLKFIDGAVSPIAACAEGTLFRNEKHASCFKIDIEYMATNSRDCHHVQTFIEKCSWIKSP